MTQTVELLQQLIALQDEAVRLLAVDVRQRSETQGTAVVALSEAGISSLRIADLLGIPADTVRKTISRAKKK